MPPYRLQRGPADRVDELFRRVHLPHEATRGTHGRLHRRAHFPRAERPAPDASDHDLPDGEADAMRRHTRPQDPHELRGELTRRGRGRLEHYAPAVVEERLRDAVEEAVRARSRLN